MLRKWAKDYWQAVHPFDLGGAYPNFMMDDEGKSRLKATYGDNYERLGQLKKKYDPGNLFRVTITSARRLIQLARSAF